jgi:polyhydroxybutyrate depolymerase
MATAGFAQAVQLNFQVAGKARNCVMHVPSGISKPAIVFFLHGAGGSGPGFENDSKGDAAADKEKFIAVYPSGISGNWNYSDGSDDFTFMLALIDTIDARYTIDRNRVYATGFSMGGGLTLALGCKYADVFAAIAPVSAAGTACTPSRKIPVLFTFGTSDLYPTSTFMAAVTRWVGTDGCPSAPTITRPYPASNPQSGVTRISYGPCAQGTYVVADSIQGEGHQWPDPKRLNQADETWAFFKQFTLNGATVVQKQTFHAAHDQISVSYSSGIVRLRGAQEKCRARVFDTKGMLVTTAAAVQRQFEFKNNPSGVYAVMVNGKEGPVRLRMIVP